MPEVTIKYDKPETLKMLKSLSKYLDFAISSGKTKSENKLDDIIIPGDKSIDITELRQIFTERNIDAKQ